MFTVKGDGLLEDGRISGELRQLLLDEVTRLNTHYSRVAPRQFEAERRCVWTGQSRDGLKHDRPDDNEPAVPFDGAPDVRVRLADKTISELNLMFFLAAMRSKVYVVGPGNGVQRSKKLMALAEWLRTSLWGRDYARAVLEVGNYMLGDSPAVALMMVPWRERKTLEIQEVSRDDAAAVFAAGFAEQFAAADPDAVQEDVAAAGELAREEFLQALESVDEGIHRALADRMVELLPFMRPARARRVVADLRRTGRAKFPMPKVEFEGPELEPLRFGEDFVFDYYARGFHDLDVWFQGIWLTESAARQLALEEGWSQKFRDALFGVDGSDGMKGKEALKFSGSPGADEHKEQYQVLRAWVRLENDDGVVGRYWVTFHPDIEYAATGLNPSDYPTGGWPGVFFEREVLGRNILDGRGITEIVVGDQALLKKLYDGFGANAILNSVGAILSQGRKDRGQLFLQAMQEIELKPNGRLEFMRGPQFPVGVPPMIDRVQAGVDEQFGRPNKMVSDTLTATVRQATVAWMLIQLAEVWKLALMECQIWMDEETLRRVTGKDGASVIRERAEIDGPFSLALQFDPDDMNIDLLEKKAKLLKDVLGPMDREGVISWSEAVAHIVGAVFPQLEFVRPTDEAQSDEVRDEQEVFVRLLAGIDADRPTDGSLAYGVRANWLEKHLEAHPELSERLDEKTKLRVMDRMDFLRAQEQQFGANAQIGREGAERRAA